MDLLFLVGFLVIFFNVFVITSLLGRRRKAVNAEARRQEAKFAGQVIWYNYRYIG